MVRRRHFDEPELNLSALIDIFSIMLFFLMTTVTFLTLKTLNAAVPAMAKKGESVDTATGVSVSLEILPDGYSLKASGTPDTPNAKPVNVDLKLERDGNGRLPTKKLTKELWEIRKQTNTKTIMIFPEDATNFQEVIQTMDATREMPSILDPNKRVPLFTKPVLSELAK